MENFRLKVFRAAATHLNFSRAAEELLLTQPAVTQQIHALELDFGVRLFDRGGNRIILTPEGKTLLPFAEKLKEISDQAVAAVAIVSGRQAGCLSVGASQTIAQYLLPKLVAGFLRKYPLVAVTTTSGNTDAMIEAVVAHRAHLALIEGPALSKGVHVEPFLRDQMVLVVPADHRWADQEIDVSALKSASLLTREIGSGSRRVVETALAQAGLKKKDISPGMEFDSTEGLLGAVEAGLGVTFVSRLAVLNRLALGTLRIAQVRGLRVFRKFSLAYPTGPEPTCSAAAFRSFLLAHSTEFLPGLK